jgi:G3E family GTPase
MFKYSTVQQIAFADRILLNKIDLVDEQEKEDIRERIQVGIACDKGKGS